MSATALRAEFEAEPHVVPSDGDERLSGDEMYRRGLAASTGADGFALDLVTAHKWFNLAAMEGDPRARVCRAELAREMNQSDIAEAQRRAREWLRGQA